MRRLVPVRAFGSPPRTGALLTPRGLALVAVAVIVFLAVLTGRAGL